MTALGLDFATLSARNPLLIYASISGYGQTGPDAAKGGFDLVAQGESGLMSVTGEPGGSPVKAGVPVTDLGAGLFALAAILAALHHRHSTGRGQHIDTSLLEAGLALVGMGIGRVLFGRRSAGARIGASIPCAVSGHPMCRRVHHHRRRHRRTVCRASRGRLATANGSRGRNSAARQRVSRIAPLLIDEIERVTATGTRANWLALLGARGIPCGPINSFAEAFADPQVQAREMVVTTDHPVLGRARSHGIADQDVRDAAGRSRTRAAARRTHGEVLREAGFTDDEIRRL